MALKYPDRLESNNPSSYGIVRGIQVSGHKTVKSLSDLYNIPDAILSDSGNNTGNDAIGQNWYVVNEQKEYRLINWDNRTDSSGWEESFSSIYDNINGLSIQEIVPADDKTLRSYELRNANNQKLGVTINVPKDQTIKDIRLSTLDATLSEDGNIVDGTEGIALCISYITSNGAYKLSTIDYSQFIEEKEFGNGLSVENHTVTLKLDPESDTFISLGENGLKLSGIQQALDSVIQDLQKKAITIPFNTLNSLDLSEVLTASECDTFNDFLNKAKSSPIRITGQVFLKNEYAEVCVTDTSVLLRLTVSTTMNDTVTADRIYSYSITSTGINKTTYYPSVQYDGLGNRITETYITNTNIKTINNESLIGWGNIETVGRKGTANNSEAFNNSNIASGAHSHAEGYNNTASASYSHAEGGSNIASGTGSHTEGYSNQSIGSNSHSEGNNTIANGNNSHAEGCGTITTNVSEHAQGMYNQSNTGDSTALQTIHSIGIGTSENRKNAQEVMADGSYYVDGIGSYDGTNINSAKTLQSVVSELQSASSESVTYSESTERLQKQGEDIFPFVKAIESFDAKSNGTDTPNSYSKSGVYANYNNGDNTGYKVSQVGTITFKANKEEDSQNDLIHQLAFLDSGEIFHKWGKNNEWGQPSRILEEGFGYTASILKTVDLSDQSYDRNTWYPVGIYSPGQQNQNVQQVFKIEMPITKNSPSLEWGTNIYGGAFGCFICLVNSGSYYSGIANYYSNIVTPSSNAVSDGRSMFGQYFIPEFVGIPGNICPNCLYSFFVYLRGGGVYDIGSMFTNKLYVEVFTEETTNTGLYEHQKTTIAPTTSPSFNIQSARVFTTSRELQAYLSKTNTTSYTPTQDYNPSTKKYVDDSISPYNDLLKFKPNSDFPQTDVNTLTTLGLYAVAGGTDYNAPSDSQGFVLVSSNGDSNYFTQTYVDSGGRFWSRGHSSGGWSEWAYGGTFQNNSAPISTSSGVVTQVLEPGRFYVFSGESKQLTLTLQDDIAGQTSEYQFQFTSGASPTALILPDTIKWIGDHEIYPNTTYQVSIQNNIAVMGGC